MTSCNRALLILQVAWLLLGYPTSYGYLPTFARSTNTPKDAQWLVEEVIGTRCRRAPSSVRGRVWRFQTWAGAAGRGSRRVRSQSTVRLTPSVRSVSGFQPSTRPARVGSNALA